MKMNSVSYLLALTIFFSLLANLTAADQTNLIETACGHSAHKEFCISSLESDPTSKTTDITGLAFIALKLASSTAANTTSQIKLLLNQPDLDPVIEQGLEDCSDHYLDAIDQIDDSLAALSVNAFKDIDTWVNVAITDAEACEAGLKGQPGDHASVMSRENDEFKQMCNNALAIAKLVKH